MCKIDIKNLSSVHCPKCRTKNETDGMSWWKQTTHFRDNAGDGDVLLQTTQTSSR